ncbi:7TM diverse intracellular signaling domain-containing protein [Flavobacterium sp.]|uniref:sensor histidine kinase n=1 Tax=Flavobacterium sp. TaxID=239 RepID=UPI003753C8BB
MGQDYSISILTVIILGSILLAFIYHIVLYCFSKDKLIIHYLLYIFFAGLLSLNISGLYSLWFGATINLYNSIHFNEATQIIYLAFYFNFILQSVEVEKSKSTFLYYSWLSIMIILITYSVVNVILSYKLGEFDDTYGFFGIRIFIFVLTGMMLIRCYKLRNITFQRYILYGCSIYFIIGLISFITNMYRTPNMLINPPEWLIIGSFIDIVFFSIAISYRNKQQWESINLALLNDANEIIAMQNLVLEKQNALEDERSRIATDMHDDLGSGLTQITYLSQMAMNDFDNKSNLFKIKKTATDLVENMSEIIWAMKEENNTLEDLITYIKIYSFDYLESNKIDTQITIPEHFNKIIVTGNNRKNIFLCVKESLHNIVKHSNAKNVIITITYLEILEIKIQDNGIGFTNQLELKTLGNGLRNMKSRMEKTGGQMEIFNKNGAVTLFTIPIKKLNQ